MNAAPSSQQKGQGSSPSKEALCGAFPEAWEQQGGREAGRGGSRSPALGAPQLKTSRRGGMKFPQAPLSFTLPPSRNSVLTCQDLLGRKAGEERRKKKNRGAGGNQNLEQFMRPVSILLMARRCCAPRLLQSSQ